VSSGRQPECAFHPSVQETRRAAGSRETGGHGLSLPGGGRPQLRELRGCGRRRQTAAVCNAPCYSRRPTKRRVVWDCGATFRWAMSEIGRTALTHARTKRSLRGPAPSLHPLPPFFALFTLFTAVPSPAHGGVHAQGPCLTRPRRGTRTPPAATRAPSPPAGPPRAGTRRRPPWSPSTPRAGG